MSTESSREELEALPFEQALEKLEALVARMETGKLPLEELMQNFEAGSELAKICRAKLDTLERKIELLTRDDGDRGSWTLRSRSPLPDPERAAGRRRDAVLRSAHAPGQEPSFRPVALST